MKTKNMLLTAVVLGAFSLASVWGINNVKANESSNYPPIVQKLVERFNLNPTEVEKVFDEVREEKHQQMQARFEERLNQLVSEGKLTQEQKQAIIDKKEELRSNREDLQNLSPEERAKKRKEHREELESWAEQNGIDLSLLPRLVSGPHHHQGFGRDFAGK